MPLGQGETQPAVCTGWPRPQDQPPQEGCSGPCVSGRLQQVTSLQLSSFACSLPCPHTPGSRKHMFAQNLVLRRRSIMGAGPEAGAQAPPPCRQGDMGAAALSPGGDLDPARL